MSRLFFQDFLCKQNSSGRPSDRKVKNSNNSMREKNSSQILDLQEKNLQLMEYVSDLELKNNKLSYEMEAYRIKLETNLRLNQDHQSQQLLQAQHQIQIFKDQIESLLKQSDQNSQIQNNYQNQYSEQYRIPLLKKEQEYTILETETKAIIQQKEKDIAMLLDSTINLEADYNLKQRQFDEFYTNITRELQMQKNQNSKIQLSNKNLAHENQLLQNQLQDQSMNDKQLNENNKQQKAVISDMESQMKEMEKCIKTLKVEKKVLLDSNLGLKEKVKQIQQLQQRTVNLEGQNQELQKLCQQKEDQIIQLEHIAYGFKQSADQGKENISLTLQKYQQLMSDCDTLEKQIEKLEGDNNYMQREFEAIENENKQLRLLNKEIHEENDNLTAENEGMSQEITKLSKKVVELQQYAAGFQKELKEYMQTQQKINNQKQLQNSSLKMRNSYNSEESVQQSPLHNIQNSQAQLKKIIKNQAVESKPNFTKCDSTQNTKRHQQRIDSTNSKLQTDRFDQTDIQFSERSFQGQAQKENSLQVLQDKYYALRNRIYDQKN
ncbi:hypothetical protein pb186bvf_008652 [Paramecium bursaria]